MEVLKIVAEGFTTSFRYPHFMHGVQPTFEMPPPATIYGHICSAVGELVNPASVQFAVHFTFRARFEDPEYTHLLRPASGSLPGTSAPKAMEGAANLFTRQILFLPRLVLYVNKPEWGTLFRNPRYPVALGRSQDLFAYTSVSVVRLTRVPSAYFEHTLAPYAFARRMAQGVVVLMPRFVDPDQNRHPSFQRYVVLHRRAHSRQFLRFADEPEMRFWADPTEPMVDGDPLGLVFHTWIDDEEDMLQLAQSH